MRFKIRHHGEDAHFMRARFIVTPQVGHLINITQDGHMVKYRVVDATHSAGDHYDEQLTTLDVIKAEEYPFKGGHYRAVD